MGHYEDIYMEIMEQVKEKGIEKEFQAQLDKMQRQEKHKYKEVRDRWSYAYNKVLKNLNNGRKFN